MGETSHEQLLFQAKGADSKQNKEASDSEVDEEEVWTSEDENEKKGD